MMRFFKRSAFLLSICVLGGLVLGWFLPATQHIVTTFAYGQIIMAVIVLVQESIKFSREYRGR